MQLFFMFYAIGPSLLGYSLAYIFKKPDEWKNALFVIIISLIITLFAHTKGTKWLRKIVSENYYKTIQVAKIGDFSLGIIFFFLFYLFLL